MQNYITLLCTLSLFLLESTSSKIQWQILSVTVLNTSIDLHFALIPEKPVKLFKHLGLGNFIATS